VADAMVGNVESLHTGVLHSAAQVDIGLGRDGLSVTLHYNNIASHFVVVDFRHREDFEVEQTVEGKFEGAGIGRYHLEFDRGLPARHFFRPFAYASYVGAPVALQLLLFVVLGDEHPAF